MGDHPITAPLSAKLFKGIALFTPGGDLVYCIDPQKRNRWHLQLCAILQETLGLTEPPHFLVPNYTATIDCWLDPQTQQVRIFAEAAPRVLRHQALLNVLFGVNDVEWQAAPVEAAFDPLLIASYRNQFPQLWENHDLVIRFERLEPQIAPGGRQSTLSWSIARPAPETQGYVLRLFVSGNSSATESILHNLHQVLEKTLQQPYTLKVIDIHKHPEQAEADQIAATPTLVRAWPHPVKKIVGDLTNMTKSLQAIVSVDQEPSL